MAPPRGSPRDQQGSARGRGGCGTGQSRGPARNAPAIAAHVETAGVTPPGYGQIGRTINVTTNHFQCEIPESVIHHYDVAILPHDKVFPLRFNMKLIDRMQTELAPDIFTPRAVYDGRKNLFAPRRLPFGNTDSREFTFPPLNEGGKALKVRLTRVAEINPESALSRSSLSLPHRPPHRTLARFLRGQQNHDSTVLTAITALNVAIGMEPTLNPTTPSTFVLSLPTDRPRVSAAALCFGADIFSLFVQQSAAC